MGFNKNKDYKEGETSVETKYIIDVALEVFVFFVFSGIVFRPIDAVGIDSSGDRKGGENERGSDSDELCGGREFDSDFHAERPASRGEPQHGEEDSGRGVEAL